MTYPLSSAVTAGQPTLAAHYNNLRNDALYSGNDLDNSVGLANAMKLFYDNLVPELLDTDRIRIPASTSSPATVMVNGYLLQNTANADLASAGKPSGSAATWYLFANRTAGSAAFTISVNSSSTAATDQRLIGRFYWNGSAIVPETIRLESSFTLASLIDYHVPQRCDGRLTLTTATPITPTDVTGGTLYFTPYLGNRIALYTGGVWRLYAFTEISVSFAGVASGTNSDVFIYDNAGTLTLERVAWSNDTTRATALTAQDGVYVKSGETHKRYLGTARTSSLGNVSDAIAARYLFNCYNRVLREMHLSRNSSHTYNSTARAWNNDSTCLLPFVNGLAEGAITGHIAGSVAAGTYGQIGIGYDTFASFNNQFGSIYSTLAGSTVLFGVSGSYTFPTVGYHYLGASEASSGTSTFQFLYFTASLMM